MAGGAPVGMNTPTPDLWCRTNSNRINSTTMQGNNSTTPSGIDMLELPFNRNGRRKNANLDDGFEFPFIFASSSAGRSADEGNRFMILCTKPILAPSIKSATGCEKQTPGSSQGDGARRGYYNIYR